MFTPLGPYLRVRLDISAAKINKVEMKSPGRERSRKVFLVLEWTDVELLVIEANLIVAIQLLRCLNVQVMMGCQEAAKRLPRWYAKKDSKGMPKGCQKLPKRMIKWSQTDVFRTLNCEVDGSQRLRSEAQIHRDPLANDIPWLPKYFENNSHENTAANQYAKINIYVLSANFPNRSNNQFSTPTRGSLRLILT